MLDQQVGTPEVGSEAYWSGLVGTEQVISGTPYSRLSPSDERQAFFGDCKPVFCAPARIVRVGEYAISNTTHKHVPAKLGSFFASNVCHRR